MHKPVTANRPITHNRECTKPGTLHYPRPPLWPSATGFRFSRSLWADCLLVGLVVRVAASIRRLTGDNGCERVRSDLTTDPQ
jgi:hypothetical protein